MERTRLGLSLISTYLIKTTWMKEVKNKRKIIIRKKEGALQFSVRKQMAY